MPVMQNESINYKSGELLQEDIGLRPLQLHDSQLTRYEKMTRTLHQEMQDKLRLTVDPRHLHNMFFSIGLWEYCTYLHKLADGSMDYLAIGKTLIAFAGYQRKKHDNVANIADRPLTVGLLLQKSNDIFAHAEEYNWYLDSRSLRRYPPEAVACYIVDMLVVKPFVLLQHERSKQNDTECD